LSTASEAFRAWWPQHDVLNGPEGKKINHHPRVGLLVFDQISFLVSDAPHLTVTINIPTRDSDTTFRLDKLLSEHPVKSLQPG